MFNSLCCSETSSLPEQKPPLEALRASNGGKEQNNGFVSNRNRIVFPPADSTSGQRDIVQRRGDATASAGTLPRPSDFDKNKTKILNSQKFRGVILYPRNIVQPEQIKKGEFRQAAPQNTNPWWGPSATPASYSFSQALTFRSSRAMQR